MATDPTLDELDRRRRDARWLIGKHAALATAKAFVIGAESLEALIERIADLYELSPEDRRMLRPGPGIGMVDSGTRLVGDLLKPAGIAIGGGEALALVRRARTAGRLAKAARAMATHGVSAAARVARGGKVVGRANPAVTIAYAGYALGTGGWFLWQANAYEQAAYDLLKGRLAPVAAAST